MFGSINRPGGHGKITKVEKQDNNQVRLTVKYVLGGCDKDLDPCLIEVPEELGTRDRKRRNLLTVAPTKDAAKKKERQPKKKKATTAAESKENTQNHRKTSPPTVSVLVPPPKRGSVEKKKGVQRRRRRSSKNSRSDSNKSKLTNNKAKWPADLPLEITVHSRPLFASPMTEKGVEDRRKYMLAGVATSLNNQNRSSTTPSTLYGRSAPAWCRDDEDDNEDDELSDSNLQPEPTQDDDDKSELVLVPPRASAMSSKAATTSSSSPIVAPEAAGLIKRVTLQSVVDREMKEAANFVDNVLKSKPGKAKQPEKKTKEQPPAASPRQEELMAVFLSLMEHNEGTAEEDCLVAQLNQQSQGTKDFTAEEVQALVDSLATSNKIMRCDGSIYWL